MLESWTAELVAVHPPNLCALTVLVIVVLAIVVVVVLIEVVVVVETVPIPKIAHISTAPMPH